MKKYTFTLKNPTNGETLTIQADTKAEAMNLLNESSEKEAKGFYSNEVFDIMKEFRKEKSEFITCEPPYDE